MDAFASRGYHRHGTPGLSNTSRISVATPDTRPERNTILRDYVPRIDRALAGTNVDGLAL